MKKLSIKVGDIFGSSSCDRYEITRIIDSENVLVRFIDFPFTCLTTSETAKQGNIKNPMYPKLFGKGFHGVGKFVSKHGSTAQGYTNTPEYSAWVNMLSRCYNLKSPDRLINGKVYEGCTVSDDWLNFQVFAEWYVPRRLKLDVIGCIRPCLDKDILSKGKKVYSSDTCCIVPQEINLAFIGIKKSNKRTIETKKEKFKILANKYIDVLEPEVYEKMINWFNS